MRAWGLIEVTVAEGLRRCRQALVAELGEAEGAMQSRLLVAEVAGCSLGELGLRGADVLDGERLAAMLQRVVAGEPVQHVLGKVAFMSLELRCDGRALIPRFETEELVALVEREIRGGSEIVDVVDVGTGSGCVALQVARSFPECRVTAVDVSEQALALAQENAKLNGIAGVRFMAGDLLSGCAAQCCDVVVANLPYVARAEVEQLDPRVRDFDPRLALDGGERGTELIERLVPQAEHALRPDGILALEIGEDQGAFVAELLRQRGWAAVRVERDMQQRDRFVLASRPGA